MSSRWNRARDARSALLATMLVVGGCTSGAAPTSEDMASTSASPQPSTTQAPTATTSEASPPPAIVGEWVGVHDCNRIVTMLKDAGLDDDYIAEQVNGNGLVPGVDAESDTLDPSSPCAEAVPRAHSHFFTADGFFGSKDFTGEQVDDGGWRLEGDDVLVINGTPFRYRIDGDELTLEPPEIDMSNCGVPDCEFLATWVRMVAMPGTTWTRGTID